MCDAGILPVEPYRLRGTKSPQIGSCGFLRGFLRPLSNTSTNFPTPDGGGRRTAQRGRVSHPIGEQFPMSEQESAGATSDENTQGTSTETAAETETGSGNEWEDKYQGQLKVNRDLEDKLKNATGLARKKLEAEYEQKLKDALELKDKPAEEQQIEAAKAEARAEALARANERILRADLRAAATGKLADPSDAALYLNLADFTVSDDGETDSDALNDAISDLLEKKPHLAAAKQNRFDGDADQGAKRATSKPPQLTREQLAGMSPQEIVAAQNAGQLEQLGFKPNP